MRDRRGQEQKATRKWKDEWMAEVDRQGDKVGDWAQHADIKRFRCKRHKVSYILTHGLYPYYKEKLVRRIQGAVGFTLGTDSATFKLNGLSKLVDIVIRWENS